MSKGHSYFLRSLNPDNDGLFYIVLEKFPKVSRLVANSIKDLPENTVSQIKSVVTPQLFNKFVLEGLNLQRGIEPDYIFVVDGNFRFGLSARSSDFIKQVETQPIFKLDSQHKTCLKNIFEGCIYNRNLN